VAMRRIAADHEGRLKNVKVIFFDVGGTLVYSNRGHIDLLAQALKTIGYKVTREEVVKANDLARHAVSRRRRRLAARMDTNQASRMWLEHLTEALELDMMGEELEVALAAAIREIETHGKVAVDPDAQALLARLAERNFRLGIISNWSADLPQYLAKHDLARHFQVVIASEAVGSSKPHREIFLRGLAAIGCAPGNAVHVGDDYWTDVVGAREIGMWPILLDRQREDPHSDCPTITRLRELEAFI
jgi:HAD superfamily hydrolase (TIGR01549 family)